MASLQEQQVRPHREEVPQRGQQIRDRADPGHGLGMPWLHGKEDRREAGKSAAPGQRVREEVQQQRIDEMNADAREVEGKRVAAEQPPAQMEIDLDDRPVEVVVALDVQDVRQHERTGALQPLEIVVEEVTAGGVTVDERDDGCQPEGAGGEGERSQPRRRRIRRRDATRQHHLAEVLRNAKDLGETLLIGASKITSAHPPPLLACLSYFPASVPRTKFATSS